MRFYFAALVVAVLPMITAQHRQIAGRIVQRAHGRLGWRASEAAGHANMDQAEVSRQLDGSHHVWLDAAVAQGPRAMIETAVSLIEEARAMLSAPDLALEAASVGRKQMAYMTAERLLEEA